jgi:Bacteriophage probable baseplate hub protein
MAARSLLSSGLPSTDYYAPNYKIEVEGRELDPESKGDVLEVKVTMDLNNMTHFDLTVNNWDDRHLSFKYSDTNVFDVGNRVHVQLGYADKLLSMVNGIITSLTPRFPESGPPTLAVGGEDSMVKLKDRKPKDGEQKKFVNHTDSEIAEIIAQRNKLVPKVTPQTERHDIVVQKNQDDATFLMERAKRIDYDCFIAVDPDSGKDALYFQPPSDTRDGRRTRVYVFEWGTSLINFNPTLSLNKQVGKVTVKGWDPTSKSIIKYTAGPDDLPSSGGGDNGPKTIQTRLQDREDIVVDQPVTSQQEAQTLARALLRERAYSYITGSGQVIGLPDLRPGDNVELKGLGKRFSGKYYVTKVEHTLGSSGYQTTFEVRNYVDGGKKE